MDLETFRGAVMRLFGVTSPEDIELIPISFANFWNVLKEMVELDITLSWPNFVKIQKQTQVEEYTQQYF